MIGSSILVAGGELLLLAVFWILLASVTFNRVTFSVRCFLVLITATLLGLVAVERVKLSPYELLATFVVGLIFHLWRMNIKADKRTTTSLVAGMLTITLLVLAWLAPYGPRPAASPAAQLLPLPPKAKVIQPPSISPEFMKLTQEHSARLGYPQEELIEVIEP